MTTTITNLTHRPRAGRIRTSLRMLLVEDDYASRLVLHTFLSRYGECHIAVNGREAVEAFRAASAQDERYDLICMDIMMPGVDGIEAVRQIRAMEEADGIRSTAGAKIVMTTALDGIHEVGRSYNELCDAYLVKPVDLSEAASTLHAWNLVGQALRLPGNNPEACTLMPP